jgi:glycosyltransferase involved in cell wall biosynthesis
MKPLSASIVLCTYNGSRFLEAQWDSLLAQSRLPDEIVVRDDASSDTTPALLNDLRRRAEDRGIRVRLESNPRNLGYVANFEAALQDASGDVLFLCDQDDIWHPDKLATMAIEFEHRPGLLAICSDAVRIDAAGVVLQRSLFEILKVSQAEMRRIRAGRGFEVLLRRSLATGATIALRRILLVRALPTPAGWIHDEWLAIMASALGGFDCVEQTLIDYRQHPGNQIGMPDRGLKVKWRDLLRPRSELIETLIARDAALRQRLQSLGDAVPGTCAEQVDDKLRHLHVRATLRGLRWARIGRVLREAADGGYRRYASGWRSALRDMLRRD